MKTRSLRGMTISEICVVLAIVATVAATLISFTVIIVREGQKSAEHLDAMREIRLAESLIEAEIESTGSASSKEYQRTDGKLNIGEHTFSKLKSIKITDISSETDTLYICRLEYELSGSEEIYTFCVNPNIGDIIGEGGFL